MAKLNAAVETIPAVSSRLEELENRIDTHVQQEAEQDAALDAAERQLRATINQRTQERRAQKEAEQAAEQRREANRRARRKAYNLKKSQQQLFIIRNCRSVAIAAALSIGYAIGAIHFWLALPGMILAIVYCIANFAAYITRNRKEVTV